MRKMSSELTGDIPLFIIEGDTTSDPQAVIMKAHGKLKSKRTITNLIIGLKKPAPLIQRVSRPS